MEEEVTGGLTSPTRPENPHLRRFPTTPRSPRDHNNTTTKIHLQSRLRAACRSETERMVGSCLGTSLSPSAHMPGYGVAAVEYRCVHPSSVFSFGAVKAMETPAMRPASPAERLTSAR